MDGSTRDGRPRALTPPVIVSALFLVACAAIAVTFVAARGGLQLPVAANASHPAAASPARTPELSAVTSGPTAGTTTTPTVTPSTAPPVAVTPSPEPSPSPEPTDVPDPLAELPSCPDHPGCYEYAVRRGDTLSGVASRYRIPVSTVRALNPELDAAGTIVVGQVLYLGRQPWVRLDKCGGETADCYLYVVRPGDGLATIAARFGLPVEAILDENPEIPNANTIYSGQVIRLQYQHGVI